LRSGGGVVDVDDDDDDDALREARGGDNAAAAAAVVVESSRERTRRAFLVRSPPSAPADFSFPFFVDGGSGEPRELRRATDVDVMLLLCSVVEIAVAGIAVFLADAANSGDDASDDDDAAAAARSAAAIARRFRAAVADADANVPASPTTAASKEA
jgi:hypothetical protein